MGEAEVRRVNDERLCLMPRRLVLETKIIGAVTASLLTLAVCYFAYDAATDSPWPLLGFLVLMAPILPFLLPAGISSWRDAHTVYEMDSAGFTRNRPHHDSERVLYEDIELIRGGTMAGGRHLQIRYRRSQSAAARINIPLPLGQNMIELMHFLGRLLDSPASVAFDAPVRRLVQAWCAAGNVATGTRSNASRPHSGDALTALADGRIDAARRAFEKAEKAREPRDEAALMLTEALYEIESAGL